VLAFCVLRETLPPELRIPFQTESLNTFRQLKILWTGPTGISDIRLFRRMAFTVSVRQGQGCVVRVCVCVCVCPRLTILLLPPPLPPHDDATGVCPHHLHGWCETRLFEPFLYQPDHLPRQARDKHREGTPKKEYGAFCAGCFLVTGFYVKSQFAISKDMNTWMMEARGMRKRLFEPFVYKSDLFTKTGLGQTWGELKKRLSFSQVRRRSSSCGCCSNR
jgi:hypothetical protein